MDEVVAEKYRELLEEGFKNAGSLENPTMFIDTKAEGVSICGKGESDYINIYIMVSNGVIDDIKYLCSCDPTANVVIEVLCDLVKGKTIAQAKALTREQFYQAIGSDGGFVRRKVWGSIELLNRVFSRFETKMAESAK
jgi:NifU-like protein involved in Fe-S cluster formation